MKVHILLDKSGSMGPMWEEAIQSVNKYVAGLSPTTHVHLAAFSSENYVVLRDVPASMWAGVDPSSISPDGYTPLLDSFMRITREAERGNDPQTVVVVMTDGHENASREYSLSDVRDRISRFEKKEWPVVFLGANFDNSDYVSMFGANKDRTFRADRGRFWMAAEELSRGTAAYAATTSAMSFNVSDATRRSMIH